MTIASKTHTPALQDMPDVAKNKPPVVAGTLDQVGMSEVEVLVRLNSENGTHLHIPARAKGFVNLVDPNEKGIHMSRLFAVMQEDLAAEILSPDLLAKILQEFKNSHQESSDRAHFEVSFDYPVYREALVSKKKGLRFYPITLSGELSENGFTFEMAVRVTYSSTCPCSAALARQLIQKKFDADFAGKSAIPFATIRDWIGSEEGIVATPHSQRSHADVKIKLDPKVSQFNFLSIIDLLEDALKTPVQAAVKREDEQEFALLNGANLMFCEDAARRMKKALNAETYIQDFWLRATHIESLHPHDAVAVAVKGLKNGYRSS